MPVESECVGPRARDVLLAALTFASGAVDAISYFGLGKIFFKHHTRVMPVGAHDLHDHWISTIQVDENIACVLVSGVGLEYTSHPSQLRTRRKPMVAARTNWVAVQSRSPGNGRLFGGESNGSDTARWASPRAGYGWPAKSEKIRGRPRPQYCNRNNTPYNEFSADGEQCLNCLSHLRGQVHFPPV